MCICIVLCRSNTPISKILVLIDEANLDSTMALLQARLKSDVAHLIKGNFFIEILHPSVNKGEGLKGLCASMGVPLAQVVAFGDGANAWNGCCMSKS